MNRKPRGRKKGTPKSGGRKKGTPNKVTVEVRSLAQSLLSDRRYRATLRARLRSGEIAPAMEALLWHYAYGKPKETIQHEGGDVPLKFTLNLDVGASGPPDHP